MIIHRLSTFEYPAWNLAYVRERVSITSVLGQMVDRLEELDTLPGYETFDMFTHAKVKLRRIQTYTQRITDQTRHSAADQPQQDGSADFSDMFDFLDDAWMADVGTLDFQPNLTL